MPTRRAFAKTLGVAVATVLASALQAAETEPQPSDLPSPTADETSRLAELDAYWARVSRAVKEGDFELYVATCASQKLRPCFMARTCVDCGRHPEQLECPLHQLARGREWEPLWPW